jgi:hypothetical protein
MEPDMTAAFLSIISRDAISPFLPVTAAPAG